MDTPNPYESPVGVNSIRSPKPRKLLPLRLLAGFCLGASIPASVGMMTLFSFHADVRSLPPDTAACGNGVLLPLALLMCVAPLLGFLGALIAAGSE